MEEFKFSEDQDEKAKNSNRIRLSDIPLSSVRVDLLYYNTAQENNNTRSKLNATTFPAGKLDKDKKKNAGMLFMPLFFNAKKLVWENMWVDFIQQSDSLGGGLDGGQADEDAPIIDEQQKERIIYEQTKSKMTSLRKEKEKKENEFDNFNATLTDLKKEQLIYEIKNKMLEQMIAEKKEEYEQIIQTYYKKSL